MNSHSAPKLGELPIELINAFKAAGFSEHKYNGQDGIFIRKELTCGEMPNVKDCLVDGDILTDDTKCVVEICPDQMLQLYIADTDYVERYEFSNYEGWMALAEDAGLIPPLIVVQCNTNDLKDQISF